MVLVDERGLIVYPLFPGEGKSLFGSMKHGRDLELRNVQQLQSGLLSLVYQINNDVHNRRTA